MYAIIVGAGRAGEAVAAWLINAGHEVTVVDRSVAKCESLEDSFGGVAVLSCSFLGFPARNVALAFSGERIPSSHCSARRCRPAVIAFSGERRSR